MATIFAQNQVVSCRIIFHVSYRIIFHKSVLTTNVEKRKLTAYQMGYYNEIGVKDKGPRTKAPFTSHHPLPPKRSFNDQKLIDDWTVDSLHSYHCFPFSLL